MPKFKLLENCEFNIIISLTLYFICGRIFPLLFRCKVEWIWQITTYLKRKVLSCSERRLWSFNHYFMLSLLFTWIFVRIAMFVELFTWIMNRFEKFMLRGTIRNGYFLWRNCQLLRKTHKGCLCLEVIL